MPDKIRKNPKVNDFISSVIAPARSAIGFDKTSHSGGTTDQNDFKFASGVVPQGVFAVTPNSHNNINPSGGRITASDLAVIFQHYAYNLTSIRRATVTKLKNFNNGDIGNCNNDPPQPTAWVTESSNQVTALAPEYRMSLGSFNAQVRANPNPFDNLQPGDPASESSIDSLIGRLASVVSGSRSQPATIVRTCHSSCHGNCHCSRGRR